MSLQEKMESQYSFETKGDDEFVSIKTGEDFPYRIRKEPGVWVLTQAFSARATIKPTYKSIGVFLSRDEALMRIIKRHNKSCKHMTWWTQINV